MDTKDYYEKIYDQDVDLPNLKSLKSIAPFKQIKKNLFSKYIKGGNILEVGCGLGEYVGLFNSTLFGTDISFNALKKAKVFSPKVSFFQANGEKLPIKDESFDCILLPDVIEHVVDDTALFKEVHRVLKSNGKILITSQFNGRYKTTENKDINLWTNVTGEGGDLRIYGLDLIDKLKSSGFKKVEFKFLYGPLTSLINELKMGILKRKGINRKDLLSGRISKETKHIRFYPKILYIIHKLDFILFSRYKGHLFFLVMEK